MIGPERRKENPAYKAVSQPCRAVELALIHLSVEVQARQRQALQMNVMLSNSIEKVVQSAWCSRMRTGDWSRRCRSCPCSEGQSPAGRHGRQVPDSPGGGPNGHGAERTGTATSAVSRWVDDVHNPNPFIAKRFGSPGNARARPVPLSRGRMVERVLSVLVVFAVVPSCRKTSRPLAKIARRSRRMHARRTCNLRYLRRLRAIFE